MACNFLSFFQLNMYHFLRHSAREQPSGVAGAPPARFMDPDEPMRQIAQQFRNAGFESDAGARAVEAAARELAACLLAEDRTARAVAAIEAEIAARTEAASNIETSDREVEAFGVWLRTTRQDLQAAMAARERAEAETARARAVLLVARAATAAEPRPIGEDTGAGPTELVATDQARG